MAATGTDAEALDLPKLAKRLDARRSKAARRLTHWQGMEDTKEQASDASGKQLPTVDVQLAVVPTHLLCQWHVKVGWGLGP